jgi:phosphatidylserine decarboxylase
MTEIIFIDRQTGQKQVEKIYQDKALRFLYGDGWATRFFSPLLLPLICRSSLFSRFFGALQKQKKSSKKIVPFIREFGVDESEFLDPVSSYQSFNEFFIRRLKPEARPIDPDPDVAIIPADGRYYFYENISHCNEFIVKGEKFCLKELLRDDTLAEKYQEGSMVLARLCPTDYHRFHFPVDCIAGETKLINGWLYSVNPLAIRKNIHTFSQNKRTLCQLDSAGFGKVLYLEVGATTVGSIQETYTPNQPQLKGAEKGYFEFGGSALVLLFPPRSIRFDEDLLKATQEDFEIRCLLGQRMGSRIGKRDKTG